MTFPKVSVIIPSYNHEQFVCSAIESVLAQEYKDYELLVADDCSNDNSLSLIESYAGVSRLRIFSLRQNVGACECLNFLIGKASGEYLAVLNSDDIWLPHKLGKQVAFLDSNSQYAACFSWADLIDENGCPYEDSGEIPLDIFKQNNVDRYAWIRRFFYNGNSLCHPSLLIRRKIYLELGGYNQAFRQLPDFDFWLRLLRQYSFYVIEEVLVYHRRLSGALVNTSAATLQNISRDRNEFAWLVRSLFSDIDDSLFIAVFKDDFRRKEALSGVEIACEKYFLLLSNNIHGGCLKHLAIDHFMASSMMPRFLSVMTQLYSYSPSDFYEVSSDLDEYICHKVTSLENDLASSRKYLNSTLDAFSLQSQLLASLVHICKLLLGVVARAISSKVGVPIRSLGKTG